MINPFRLLLLVCALSLTLYGEEARYTVVAIAGKQKRALYADQKELHRLLKGSYFEKQIEICPSTHPVWKWRLCVSALENEEEARALLSKIRTHYPDAYLLKNKPLLKRLYADRSHRATRESTQEKQVMININNMTLQDMAQMVTRITGKNILIPEKLKGKINFIGTRPIRKDKIFTLFNQVLLNNGYTLVDSDDGFLTIVKSKEALMRAPSVSNDTKTGTMQTAILPLQFVKSLDLMKQAKALTSRYGKVSVANSINSLIVTDYPENIRAIREIISLASRYNRRTVKFITFHRVDVASIFSKAKEIVNSFFSAESREKRVRVVENKNANSLTLIGDRKDIATIFPYIKKLDSGSDQEEKNIEIVYVKNSDAESIAALLNNLISHDNIQKTIEDRSSLHTRSEHGKRGGKKASKKRTTQRVANIEVKEHANITFDKQLNALIIFGTQKERTIIKRIIHQLDIERRQVYVQAKVLEINNDRASKLGMRYGIVGGVSNSSGLYALSNKMGLSDAGAGFSLAHNLNLALPNASKIFALGAAVSLLTENSAANILSEPSILCINNEAASLYVGKTISVITQSSVATSSTDLPRNTYTREDVGLTLKILPRISSDHKVVLNVEISSEDILPGSSDVLPKTTKRVVKTSAIVKNGETIILGGMVRDKISDSVEGVPIVKNIPLVGKLFSHKSKERTKTTLVVMLTPFIIEKSADLTNIKEALGKLYVLEKEYVHNVKKSAE